MKTYENLITRRGDLANTIRHYVRSNLALWQEVRAWSLEADGRNGYASTYYHAYAHGEWRLPSSIKDGCYHVSVNLISGELVVSGTSPSLCAGDRNIVSLDYADLVVGDILSRLKEYAAKPPFASPSFQAMTDEKRDEIASVSGFSRPVKETA